MSPKRTSTLISSSISLRTSASSAPLRLDHIYRRHAEDAEVRRVFCYYPLSMSNSFDQFLEEFRETIVDATTRLRDITPEQSRNKVSDENWSCIEILGHLVDSAANNHQRFVRAQFTDDLVFSGYEQDGWVSVQRYRDESWPDLIQLWSSYNQHFLHVFAAIPEATRTNLREKHNLDEIALVAVPRNQPATLEYLMRDYVDHLRHHLNQIFAERS